MNKQAGNILLWIVLGIVAIGLGTVIVWRYFAATDSLNNAQQADEQTSQTAPAPKATIDIKEYGLKLSYDSSYGPLTYKVVDDNVQAADGTMVKSRYVQIIDEKLDSGRKECADIDDIYKTVATVGIDDQKPTSGLEGDTYIVKDGKYLTLYFGKVQGYEDESCRNTKTINDRNIIFMSLDKSFDSQGTKLDQPSN